VKTILTTGYFDPSGKMVKEQEKLIDRVILKPWDITALRREVKTLLAKNSDAKKQSHEN
jgi:hypothetical protein